MKTEAFVLAVTARDRPGIIAAITEAVFALGGNVTELSQTVMGGHFTLILRADLPAGLDPARIKQAVEQARPELELAVHVRRYRPEPLFQPAEGAQVHFLTVQGPDRPGLIAAVTRFLAGHDVNIEDLYTRSKAGRITMIFQIHPRDAAALESLHAGLPALAERLGVDLHLLHRDILRTTSEVGAIRRLVQP